MTMMMTMMMMMVMMKQGGKQVASVGSERSVGASDGQLTYYTLYLYFLLIFILNLSSPSFFCYI